MSSLAQDSPAAPGISENHRHDPHHQNLQVTGDVRVEQSAPNARKLMTSALPAVRLSVPQRSVGFRSQRRTLTGAASPFAAAASPSVARAGRWPTCFSI